jgi:LacI family transcriptional regulator
LGTEFEARKYDHYVLLTTVQEMFRVQDSIPRFLLEKNVDGVILAGRVPDKLIEFVQRAEFPLVLIDYFSGKGRYSKVLIDNSEGARMAVDHLIRNGHKQIAFIAGEKSHPSISARLMGYTEALRDHGLPFNDTLISDDEPHTGLESGYKATCRLLDGEIPFTAIFASNDTMAIGAMQCLKERRLKIPKDVSIIGFDDIETCLQVDPRLSSVKVFKEELGAIAVRQLVEMIQKKRRTVGEILVPVELILRESTRIASKN